MNNLLHAKPNIIVAGVTKAGTTSLFTYLADHPDVCASSVKEISHFLPIRFQEPARSMDNYLQYFKHCSNERYKLEASPAYFLGGKELVHAVNESIPDVKVIIILREPVSRCISFFKFSKNMLELPKDMSLREYYEHCRQIPYDSFKQRGNHMYYGLASGAYVNYLDAWIEVFNERLKICFFEDFKQNTKGFVKQICDWLEIDDTYYDGYKFVKENIGRNIHSRVLQKYALKINYKYESFLRSNLQLKRILRSIYFAINGAKQKMSDGTQDEETLKLLRKYYVPYNAQLKKLLLDTGTGELPEWLSDNNN